MNRPNIRKSLSSLCCLMFLSGILSAQDFDFGAKTKVRLLVPTAMAKAGDTIEIGVLLKMPQGWHTYWRNPGENGAATSIKLNLPKGITAGAIQWPVPEKIEWLEMFNYGYHKEVLLIIPITLDAELKAGKYDLKGKVEWLECEETCIPGEAEVTGSLVVGNKTEPGEHAAFFNKWHAKLPDTESTLELSAKWAGEAKKGARAINLTVQVGQGVKVEFLPYSTKGLKWSITHSSTIKRAEDPNSTIIQKIIKSQSGTWPTKIPGILRMEGGGRVKGFRTEFILPGSWKRLSPKEIVKSFTTLWQAGEKLRQLRQTGVEWRIWSPKAVVEARAAGHPVLVCFSADWCLVSKYNQHKAIEVKPVFQKLEKIKGVAFFADYTEKNPEITKALQRHKRAGPPLVLVYPPKGNPIILPLVMNSPEKILEALDKATPPR